MTDETEMWKQNCRNATGTISLIRAMIGEMFGPVASIESEEATLLRGPEPKHSGEAILEALQRVQASMETARNEALRKGAAVGYMKCAETRHVRLGMAVSDAILALIEGEQHE